MSTRELLLETGTEELPPKALAGLSRALQEEIERRLEQEQLAFSSSRRFATPRRLAVLVSDLVERQPDQLTQRFGPTLQAAFDGDGAPTLAAQGFARSCGVAVEALATATVKGVEKLVWSASVKGRSTREIVPELVRESLASLPIPRRMRWGASREEFARPVHWAVLLYGSEPLAVNLLGVETAARTFGHRFHHNHPIALSEATDYETLLEETGYVIADFDKRRELIRELVQQEGIRCQTTAVIDEALLEEVTSLVEYPVALTGRFDEEFLEVPHEALILTMKSHQRCFHLLDGEGRLAPAFVTVSNIASKDPAQVIAGNERVIRPRLADARFFFETDKRRSLASRAEQLGQVVFQDKLGTLADKSRRVARLCGVLATAAGADKSGCERAAMLAKCDLLTSMVGEFAELQGVMGCHYASHDGEPEEVAASLREQYLPRFAGDVLPETPTGMVLAIADRLDTITGMFGIGQPPTGSKDPFSLRRSAIGLLRIVVERELDMDLLDGIEAAAAGYQGISLQKGVVARVFEFLLERFRAWYLDEGISNPVFQSVFALKPPRPLDFHQRIMAVHHFAGLPQAQALAVANKRVSNLLARQEHPVSGKVDPSLLQEQAEQSLSRALREKVLEVTPLFETGDYKAGLQALAGLKEDVDRFFDEVLVMCDDAALRSNRLALLQSLREQFLRTADISHLH